MAFTNFAQIFFRLCANPFFRPVIKIVIYAATENPNPLKLSRLSQTNQQGPSANIKSPAQKQLCDDPRPIVAIFATGSWEKKFSRNQTFCTAPAQTASYVITNLGKMGFTT